MKKNSFFIFCLIFLFVNKIYLSENNKIKDYKKASLHYLEKIYINDFLSFTKKLSININIFPIIDDQKRNLFIYIENHPDYDNFIAAVKIISARYLLPLMKEMLKKNINDLGYLLLYFNIKGKNKLLSATVLPADAILLTANRITLNNFFSKIKIKITDF